MRLFLLLVTIPIVEIALFIEIGGWLGTWPTIGIVILTALIGSILLRQQGLSALNSLQSRLAQGENPGRLLADGAMILVAGVLLLTPGFFTDAVGFALLLPPVRAVLWAWGAKNIKIQGTQTSTFGFQSPPTNGHTVDGAYEEVDPEPESNEGPPQKR